MKKTKQLFTFFFPPSLARFNPHFPSHALSPFFTPAPPLFPSLRSWTVVLLSFLLSSPVSQCLLPAKNNSLWISLSLVMFHLLDSSQVPITSRSGHRDLCRLCSWHRFRAVSRASWLLYSANKPNHCGESVREAGELARESLPESSTVLSFITTKWL